MGAVEVDEAINAVGQFTVEPLPGVNSVTPGVAGFTEVLWMTTADELALSNTVAVML